MGPEISVVVPMRNESPNVEGLYRELTSSLTQFGRSYEILAIDDGSTDDTFALLATLQAKDPRVRVIRFRRNFGQTAAFAAGFAHARGRYIVTVRRRPPERSRRHPRHDPDARSSRISTSSAAGGRIGRTRSSTGACRR